MLELALGSDNTHRKTVGTWHTDMSTKSRGYKFVVGGLHSGTVSNKGGEWRWELVAALVL